MTTMDRNEAAGVLTSRAWITLDRDALAHNVAVLRTLLPPDCTLMPAVKADAYGHGAVWTARELNRLGVDAFCVATAEEGAQLREHGIRGSILVLGYTHPTGFPLLERCGLTQTVVDGAYARRLNAYGRTLSVHIGVDTGMHRLGTDWEQMERLCAMFQLDHLRVEGIFTHLCVADSDAPEDRDFTRRQGKVFREVVEGLKARGASCPKAHLLNSAGLLRYPELGGNYARVGIALYGVLSTPGDTDRCKVPLRPVLSVKARVAAVKTLQPGESAGYGRAFHAERKTRLAVLSIGYADGLPRALSCGVGSVLIDGQSVPIAGRICMDQALVDVTGLPSVAPGDVAVVLGASGDRSIRACDMAKRAHTISNEILSRLGARLKSENQSVWDVPAG